MVRAEFAFAPATMHLIAGLDSTQQCRMRCLQCLLALLCRAAPGAACCTHRPTSLSGGLPCPRTSQQPRVCRALARQGSLQQQDPPPSLVLRASSCRTGSPVLTRLQEGSSGPVLCAHRGMSQSGTESNSELAQSCFLGVSMLLAASLLLAISV